VSRGGGSEKDETCRGNVVRAEHIRSTGRTDEDDTSLSNRRRGSLEMVESNLDRSRMIRGRGGTSKNTDREECEIESN